MAGYFAAWARAVLATARPYRCRSSVLCPPTARMWSQIDSAWHRPRELAELTAVTSYGVFRAASDGVALAHRALELTAVVSSLRGFRDQEAG